MWIPYFHGDAGWMPGLWMRESFSTGRRDFSQTTY
jgi:hypothetical protein